MAYTGAILPLLLTGFGGPFDGGTGSAMAPCGACMLGALHAFGARLVGFSAIEHRRDVS